MENTIDIKQAKEFKKYIAHNDIVELVKNINANETKFEKIKSLLDESINKIFSALPIQHYELKKNVFAAFMYFIKNAETGFWGYGITISYVSADKIVRSGNTIPRIPRLTTIAKIAVDEWANEFKDLIHIDTDGYFKLIKTDDSEIVLLAANRAFYEKYNHGTMEKATQREIVKFFPEQFKSIELNLQADTTATPLAENMKNSRLSNNSLQRKFIEVIDELALITADLLTTENSYFTNGKWDTDKINNNPFTTDLSKNNKETLISEYSKDVGIYHKIEQILKNEIYPILVVSEGGYNELMIEIEQCLSNNGQGYINTLLDKFESAYSTSVNFKKNNYSGGQALETLQYYFKVFFGKLHNLCRNYNVDISKHYIFSLTLIQNKIQLTATPQAIDDKLELTNGQEKNLPKVFVSYSYDGEEHEKWVCNFVEKLRNKVNVIFDKDVQLGKSLTNFMEQSIEKSQRVICVMTPNYKKKTDNLQGGVGYEYSIITAKIFQDIDTSKFIPLIRAGNENEAIPTALQSRKYCDMRNDDNFEKELEKLEEYINK